MIDYIIIGIIAFSILVSLLRGFVREVLSLGSWVVAFIVASRFLYVPCTLSYAN